MVLLHKEVGTLLRQAQVPTRDKPKLQSLSLLNLPLAIALHNIHQAVEHNSTELHSLLRLQDQHPPHLLQRLQQECILLVWRISHSRQSIQHPRPGPAAQRQQAPQLSRLLQTPQAECALHRAHQLVTGDDSLG